MRDRLLRIACVLPAAPSALAAAGLAAIATAPAQASVPLEVRAISGVQAPGARGGLILDGFGSPVVNDAGEVAFLGFVSDPGLGIGGAALFGPDAAGELTLIASELDPVPGLPPGTEFRFNTSTYFPRLDDDGRIAFRAGLAGPAISPPADASGIWRWSAETGLERLARAGDPIPEAGPGVVLGPVGGTLVLPTIGADGSVGFAGTLDDFSVPMSDAAYLDVDPDGARTIVALAGMPVPGIPGATLTFLYPPMRTRAGEWSFTAFFEGPGVVTDVNDSATFHSTPVSGIAMRLRTGDPAPGMPPGVVLAWPGTAYPNDAGHFAYLTWLAGPGVGIDDDSALFGPDASGALVLLAREGDPAPDTEPDTVFDELHAFSGGIVLDAAGRVTFSAGLSGPAVTAANQYGIWRSDPATGVVERIARTDDPAPELPGLTFADLSLPLPNDAGDLVFDATLAGPGVTPDTDRAIFAIDAAGVARKLVREGDLVEFGPGDLRTLESFGLLHGTLASVPGVGQLSDAGHLVFWANASDGTNAVVVATLPEPGVGAGVAAGVVLLAWLRRRARALG